MKKTIFMFFAAVLLVGCGSEPDKTDNDNAGDASTQIREALGGMGEITAVTKTEWEDIYQVVINGQILYASADGSYFIAGDLYRTQGLVNLSETRRDDIRERALASLEDSDAIVYAPQGETKHVVWVFTDIDCPYCQRFHDDIAQYNKMGIEVRYLAFPRAGKGSPSWSLTQSVWCADDPRAALTRAKLEQPLTDNQQCDNNAVAHGYAAGREVGLRGTPMIIGADGRNLGGYLAPTELLQRLESQG